MPRTATAMETAMSPYPRRILNHGPKVASAKDTMPRARSPAFVDRNAVAFNIGPSDRNLQPPVAVRVEDRSPLRMSLLVPDVSLVPSPIPLIRRPQWVMRHPNQSFLDRPHVPGRDPPVHPEGAQVEDSIPFDAAREIHERIDVREDEIPDRAEDRLTSV